MGFVLSLEAHSEIINFFPTNPNAPEGANLICTILNSASEIGSVLADIGVSLCHKPNGHIRDSEG